MTKAATLILLSLSFTGGSIYAANADSAKVADKERTLAEQRHGLWRISRQAFNNPAVNQWRLASGLTSVGVAYDYRHDSAPVDPRLGDGGRSFSGGAETYTKYKNSTLWGHGSYRNGKNHNVKWNETADMDLIYPYVLADSVGGDMKYEEYSFSGGYAASSDRWAWGAEMSYIATLQYRDVDPRPRNITGKLDISAGAAYRIAGDYFAGLSLNFRKYKQTNDIDFKSEMGVDKVFHLTGLGTHYNRFAGTGLSTYYDGYRYGLTLDLYPSGGRGAFVSAALSRFTFDNILTEINKLPLTSAWHNAVSVQAGWLNRGTESQWGVSGLFSAYRRHGKENIFGDATSGVYPEIASLEMFADNSSTFSAQGEWGRRFSRNSSFALRLGGGWMRRTTAYIDPWRYTLINAATATAGADIDLALPGGWMIGGDCTVTARLPYSCRHDFTGTGTDNELRQLEQIEEWVYHLDSNRSMSSVINLSAAHPITGSYLLKVGATYSHDAYTASVKSQSVTANIAFIF